MECKSDSKTAKAKLPISFILTIWNVNQVEVLSIFFLVVKFYLNYVECKLSIPVIEIGLLLSFILTIWNVN
ncbi:hypothetical protein [Clostridium sporogenes]|uniref:hypothetical protein n=1 Tax=Clostridium sporogenes TaxID=1509 RepID=UPI00138F4234